MAEFIDFPAKLRSTRRDGKLIEAASIDGLIERSQLAMDAIGVVGLAGLRTESITLQQNGSSTTNSELAPAAADPLTLVHPDDGGELEILSNVSGNDFTVAPGLYLLQAEGELVAGQVGRFEIDVRQASDDAVVGGVSPVSFVNTSSAYQGFTTSGYWHITEATAVNLFLQRYGRNVGVRNVVVSFARLTGDADLDEVHDDLKKLHTYIAEHLTDISDEVVDPTQDDSPAHYYLTQKARHTVRDVSVAFESGLYELTTGDVASSCKFEMARVGTGGGQIHGYVSRQVEGLANQGDVLHNPLSAIAALFMQQIGNDYFLITLIKSNAYDVLRKAPPNLANTAIYFKVTDGRTEHEFEMSRYSAQNIGGVNYYLMRAHLIDATAQARWTDYFTSGNSFAPILTVTFNQGSAQAGHADSPLGYSGATPTTKAYTFREDGFAKLVGLDEELDKIPEHTQEIAALEAKVALLLQVNETGIANLTSPTATHSITEATTWTARGTGSSQRDHFYYHRMSGVGLDNSLIELTWENMDVLDDWEDFDEEGASNASGSMWFHGRDLDSFFAAGHIGNTTGDGRVTVNGALQDLGRMEILMLAANDDLELAIDFFEHSNLSNSNPGRMPSNFSLTIRVWNP